MYFVVNFRNFSTKYTKGGLVGEGRVLICFPGGFVLRQPSDDRLAEGQATVVGWHQAMGEHIKAGFA